MLRISDHIDQSLRTTVCVIGSGPAGATIARLLGKSGVAVTLVESGDVEESERGQRQLAIESTGRDYPISKSRRRSLGGTSSSWNQDIGLRVRPLEETDFRPRKWFAGVAHFLRGHSAVFRSGL